MVANRARVVLASFPEVTTVTSQVGRPDDGTDTTGFFNTEYCVDLKPKEQWRPVFHENKEELIAAMDRELEKIPGAIWNFSQPIADNMEEAVSGVKGELATKVYGDDLHVLEEKGDQIVEVMRHVRGIQDLGLFRVLGQPNLNFTVDRAAAARWGINVADVQDAIQTAVGGNALTQVLQGERRYDLVMRYLPPYRDTKEAIENIRLLSPSGERVSLAQLCKIQVRDGGSEIYREGNQRYVAIKYSVRGRDLGGAVEEAIAKVAQQVKLPPGYHINWEGEYESQKRAQARLFLIVPLTIVLIFIILYTMFKSLKWALADSRQRHDGPARRHAGSAVHAHQLQCFFRHRLSGAVRRVGADRRHHAGIYQPTPGSRLYHYGSRGGGSRPPASSHHDDDAGGHAGTAARGDLACHRFGFAAALCHRHRRGADCGAGHEHLSFAHALCVGGEGHGQASTAGGIV